MNMCLVELLRMKRLPRNNLGNRRLSVLISAELLTLYFYEDQWLSFHSVFHWLYRMKIILFFIQHFEYDIDQDLLLVIHSIYMQIEQSLI